MDKNKKKIVRRFLSFISARVFFSLTKFLSLETSYRLGNFLGKIGFILIRRHHNSSLESVKIAYPNHSKDFHYKLARNSFIFMAESSCELLYYLNYPHMLEKNVEIEGEEYLRSALNTKRGVIGLSAHYGNFPLMCMELAYKGYPTNIIVRPMRDERLGEYIHKLRTKAGVKSIFSYPRKEVIKNTINVLRKGELVIIQMDQNFGTGGVWVKFFGELAATAVGPIVFAMRTKAVILPMYIRRLQNKKHVIKIMPPVDLTVSENKDEMILLNAIKFTRIIESWIKEEPFQWSWLHRRWKSRPSQKVLEEPFSVEK